MAKKIIVLDKTNQTGYFELTYLYWLDVPVNQQALRANAGVVSAYKDATQAEIDALKAGQVVEVSNTSSFANGTAVNAIKAALSSGYTQAQDMIDNSPQWNYYGTYWDGTTWTVQGV